MFLIVLITKTVCSVCLLSVLDVSTKRAFNDTAEPNEIFFAIVREFLPSRFNRVLACDIASVYCWNSSGRVISATFTIEPYRTATNQGRAQSGLSVDVFSPLRAGCSGIQVARVQRIRRLDDAGHEIRNAGKSRIKTWRSQQVETFFGFY